jgi:hypothetical protein
MPLTWLESLKPNSINSWEHLNRAFIDNFQGSMIRAGTHHDLSKVKQELNETLRSYTQRFFEIQATIANITDEDIIRYFRMASSRSTPTTTSNATARLLPWSCAT